MTLNSTLPLRRSAADLEPPAPVRGEVSPYFIARVSGAPVEVVGAMRGVEAVEALDALERAEAEVARLGKALVERLYAAVGRAEGKRARRRLLALKRDAHNGRALDAAAIAAAGQRLEPPDFRVLAAYAEAVTARERLLARYEAAYARDRDRARTLLWRAVEAPPFRNGLLLASPTLHAQMERAREEGLAGAGEVDVDAATWRRLRKLERGLLRYLTRMAMKATPFGTFCSVVEGRFAEDGAGAAAEAGDALLTFDGDPSPARSVVRLNKRLCAPLIRQLQTRPAVCRAFEVELNPTLRAGEEAFEFLADSLDGEVFRRIERYPTLDFVRSLLADGRRVRLAELIVDGVTRSGADASDAEAATGIEDYLVHLLDRGFLRYRPPVRDQDPDWDRTLEAFCRSVDDEHARAVAGLLGGLRSCLERFKRSGPSERAGIVEEARSLVFDTAAAVGLRKGRIQSRMFYEDATADARLVLGVGRDDAMFDELIELAAFATKIASPRAGQATMRAFFDSTYEPGTSVPLLRFNEDYHRGHLHEHRERENQALEGAPPEGYDLANPLGVPLVRAIHQAQSRLSRLLGERWAESLDAEEIRITAEDVASALADVPPPRDGLCRSFGAFVEVVPDGGAARSWRLSLHRLGLVSGYGKYLSRFLCVLPVRATKGARTRNGRLARSWLAEISGDDGYNANLHPALLPREIGYPTEQGDAGEHRLDTSECRVEADPADPDALRLVHVPSGERVVPIDLGFQSVKIRPALHQLLFRMMPGAGFELPVPYRPAGFAARGDPSGAADGGDRSVALEASAIVHRPRIVFGDGLVLARRAWLISKAAFPTRGADELDAAYFRRVSGLRKSHGLPRQGYVRVVGAARRTVPGPSGDSEPAQPNRPEDKCRPASSERQGDDPCFATPTATAQQEGDDGGDAEVDDHSSRASPSPDLLKPQYVDFDSPLLVEIFEKVPGPLADFTVILEEPLPDAGLLPEGACGRHAVELFVEVDFREPGVGMASNGDGA